MLSMKTVYQAEDCTWRELSDTFIASFQSWVGRGNRPLTADAGQKGWRQCQKCYESSAGRHNSENDHDFFFPFPIHKSPSAPEDNIDNLLQSCNISYHCRSLTWSPGVVPEIGRLPSTVCTDKMLKREREREWVVGKKAGRELWGVGKGKAASPSQLMVINLSLCQIKILAFSYIHREMWRERNKIKDVKPLWKVESTMLI